MQNIEMFIENINKEFKEVVGGSFIKLESGEIFTQSEVLKYIQRKLELFNVDLLHNNSEKIKESFGIENSQRLVNKNSKKPMRNHMATKSMYDGSGNHGFNIVYRGRLEDLQNMKLDKNEKLVYYVVRDFIQYPSNCVIINDVIPTFKDLEPITSLTERTIRDALKALELKGILKLVQSGHRKAIYINPEYYASGKELNIDTLKLFGLLKIDDAKIETYFE